MEADFVVFQNVARLLALVGGGLAAIFVVWSGIQWIMAAGDPQRMAMARNSILGVVAGLVIVGAGFILPGVIGDLVIRPSGGVDIGTRQTGVDCDGILREQLVLNRSVSNAGRMNYLVQRIQAQYDDCGNGLWIPVVRTAGIDQYRSSLGPWCYSSDRVEDHRRVLRISGVEVPHSLIAGRTYRSGRDSQNNILVYFYVLDASAGFGRPNNQAVCWLYLSYFDDWTSGYDD